MALVIVADNQTAGDLALSQIPAPDNKIPASSSVTLTDYASHKEVRDDAELLAHVEAGDATLTVNTNALTQAQSESFLDGSAGKKHDTNATSAPTVSDDDAAGYSEGSTWVDVTGDRCYVCIDAAVGAAVWQLVGDMLLAAVFPWYLLGASALESPVSADWTVNALAPASADIDNTALTIRAFDDTTEEGVGFLVPVPSGAVNLVLKLKSRAEPGANADVVPRIYCRCIPDDGMISAWSAGTDLTAVQMTPNERFHYDEETMSLATIGATAGEIVQFELTRNTGAGGDTLVGDWYLLQVEVGFS